MLKNEFVRTILKALNPAGYDELSIRLFTNSIKYFFSIILIAFLLYSVLSIPKLIMLPYELEDTLSAFNKLDVKFEDEMNMPISIPKEDPFITIDTTGNVTELGESMFLLTDSMLIYKIIPFSDEMVIEKEEGATLLDYKGDVADFITILILLSLPTILVMIYLGMIIKFGLLVLFVATLGFIAARIIRFGVTYPECIKIAIYASTIMVLLDAVSNAFNINIFYMQYVAFVAYFCLGSIKAGEFEHVIKRRQ